MVAQPLSQDDYFSFYSSENRDLDIFPARELEHLINFVWQQLELEGNSELAWKINQLTWPNGYFDKLRSLGTPDNIIALVGHAICSLINTHFVNNELWKLAFLFPPTINPADIALEDRTYIDVFTLSHKERNQIDSPALAQSLLSSPSILHIAGPMYSAKSGMAIEIYNLISQQIGSEHMHALIFSGMHEETIRARSLEGTEIPAKPVSLGEFVELSASMCAQSPVPGETIFIEEATFFATDPDPMVEAQNAQAFVQTVANLKEHGYNVVLIGLNNNYRGLPLAITEALTSYVPDLISYECQSYFLYQHQDSYHKVAAELTSRCSSYLGMFDFIFPILVPRDDGAGIEYFPIPREFHPEEILSQTDPVLYRQLITLNQGLQLKVQAKAVVQDFQKLAPRAGKLAA